MSKRRPPKPPKHKKKKTGSEARDAKSANSIKLAGRVEHKMQTGAKRRRQRFIAKYVVHWNATRAALEIGTPTPSASRQGSEFLREPYTLMLLTQAIEGMKEDELCSRNEIIAGLKKEACFVGDGTNHGARIAAWDKLSKIKGMQMPDQATVATVHLHFDSQDAEA